jgi:hypothetical protein
MALSADRTAAVPTVAAGLRDSDCAAGEPPTDGTARSHGSGSRPEADHDLRPFGPEHPRSPRARRPGITGAPASRRPYAPADRRRRRLLRRVPGTCIFPVVVAAPVMSPGGALTGKGHVRYSTGLADPQEADQRSPTSSCAQNSQICTALVLIGIEPAPAQNGGYARGLHRQADHAPRSASGADVQAGRHRDHPRRRAWPSKG